MANDGALIDLTAALDSMRDVALAEHASIVTDEEKTGYAGFVKEQAILFLEANRDERWKAWEDHGDVLIAGRPRLCPPGFEERNGLCVPIGVVDRPTPDEP